MLIKGLTDEDFVNYKKPSMVIATSKCDFKCDRDCGEGCCQNSPLARAKSISVSDDDIILRYMANDMKLKIVAEGIESIEEFNDIMVYDIDYIQGYYFSKALPIQEFIDFIKIQQNG